jgi:hypothetical protein
MEWYTVPSWQNFGLVEPATSSYEMPMLGQLVHHMCTALEQAIGSELQTRACLGQNAFNRVSVVRLLSYLHHPWVLTKVCSFVLPAVLCWAMLCPGAAHDHSSLRAPQQPVQQGCELDVCIGPLGASVSAEWLCGPAEPYAVQTSE